VYGIVKQSGGNISVYSRPGEGTTFRVYFPVTTHGAPEPAASVEGDPTIWPTGSETVLVVEDEESVRGFVQRSLEQQGYHVLRAAHGTEALAVSDTHQGIIHLLLTDVVMPAISGPELAAQLRTRRPAMKVVFMSGYSSDAIAHQGRLAPDSTFIEKPVSPGRLARVVRQVLDANGDRRGA